MTSHAYVVKLSQCFEPQIFMLNKLLSKFIPFLHFSQVWRVQSFWNVEPKKKRFIHFFLRLVLRTITIHEVIFFIDLPDVRNIHFNIHNGGFKLLWYCNFLYLPTRVIYQLEVFKCDRVAIGRPKSIPNEFWFVVTFAYCPLVDLSVLNLYDVFSYFW